MEALRRIREMDEAILVIMITGHGTIETAIEAMKQGAYDFILKPVDTDQLLIVVNRASEKIQFIREAEKLERIRKRTLSDLHTEKSRIHTILRSLPNGVMITNSRGEVVLMNPAFRKLLELGSDLETGNPIEDYLTDDQHKLARAKNQSLTLELPKEPLPLIMADPFALESIFGNLITNAINYTQEGGKIRVNVDLAGINIRVKVADNGFGIPEKRLDKIFEKFLPYLYFFQFFY